MVPHEVEAIIEDHLMRYYLRRERPSLARVVAEIRSACGEQGFQQPTRRTVQRRLDAMDAREVMKAREGAQAARQRARVSTFSDPKLVEKNPLAAIEAEALANGRGAFPPFPEAARAQALFLEEVQLAVLGRKSPAEAVEAISSRVAPLLP